MAELIARTACFGLLPLSAGSTRLSEATPHAMTSLAANKGQEDALSDALKAAHGMSLPATGRSTGRDSARAIWFGQGQVMVMGPVADPALAHHASLTDQSDAWAVMRLDGAEARDVLARLTPLDLRAGQFKRGHSARSLLGHMMCSITRVGEDAFLILVFRSMAATAVHEIGQAMRDVAARKG